MQYPVAKRALPAIAPLTGRRSRFFSYARSGGGIAAYLYWESDSGLTGSPVSAWAAVTGDLSLDQATAANRPAITASAFGSTQGLTFDGTNDVLVYAGKAVAETTGGTLSAIFKTPATIAAGVVLAQSDTAAANDWWELGINSTKRLYIESNNAGTKHTVVCSTILQESTAYHVVAAYDGTDFYVQLNGTEENPLTLDNAGAFAWLGRIAGTPNFSVVGCITSAGTVRPFTGTIGAVYFWDRDIT